jgi:integrase/recombinase XerD
MGKTVAFPTQKHGLKVTEACEVFLERDLSPNTRKSFKSDLLRFCETFGRRQVHSIQTKEIQDYLKKLKGRGGPAKPETCNRHLGTIHNLFSWLCRQGDLDVNPATRAERKRIGTRLPRPMKQEQIDTFFGRLRDVRERALFSFLYRSGLRIDEALSLDIEDVNFVDGTFRVIGKGDAERIGYLSEETKPLLRRYLRGSGGRKTGPVFASRQGRLSYHMARVLFKGAADGMENPDGTAITIHQLRHTFGTERAGAVDALVLRDLMGHKNIRTTMRYAAVNPERTRRAFNEFDRASR